METSLVFDQLNIKDINECTELMMDVYGREPWYDQWEFEQAKTYLLEYINCQSFRGYVIKDMDKLVAVCVGRKKTYWQGDEYYIDEFFIDTKQQGKGLGTEFLNYIKKCLKQEKIECITLLTERGIPAESFYSKNGFQTKDQNIFMFCNY